MSITDDAYGAYGPADGAPHLGDTFPDFELPLADGGTYRLEEARGAGPVLVMFYRGFW
jgi:peroxiredoxin